MTLILDIIIDDQINYYTHKYKMELQRLLLIKFHEHS